MAPPHRWIRPDVYPLFAAVGIGVTAAAVMMSRKLFAVGKIELPDLQVQSTA